MLTNRKAETDPRRAGKVQLIDATKWFKPLRKNLGKKNCELSADDIDRILETFLAFEETEQSKIFPNEAFGYRKVTVERPAAARGHRPRPRLLRQGDQGAARGGDAGPSESGAPVIKKIHKAGAAEPTRSTAASSARSTARRGSSSTIPTPTCATPSRCRCSRRAASRPSSEREVLPYAPDAWIVPDAIKIGYEINFTRHFYKPVELRSLEEIRADILAVERETEGLLEEIVGSEGAGA